MWGHGEVQWSSGFREEGPIRIWGHPCLWSFEVLVTPGCLLPSSPSMNCSPPCSRLKGDSSGPLSLAGMLPRPVSPAHANNCS